MITAGAGTLAASNYDFTTLVDGSLTINRRPIGVAADAKGKVVGSADPALTYTVAADGVGASRGLVNGDSLSGALGRAVGEAVGGYAINQGTVTDGNNPNYQIAYTGANLTISAAPVVVLVVPPVVVPPVVVPPVVVPPVVVPPVVEPPVVEPPVVVPPVVVPPVVVPPVVVPPVVVPPVVVPPVVVPPVVVPPVVQPPVVLPPVVVPPVVQPPVVVQQSGDPQAAIALLTQEASRIAAGGPDTSSPGTNSADTSPESTRNSGLVLVDVSDVPTSEQGKSRLSAKGFVNVFVVDGGINMGNNDAKSPQR